MATREQAATAAAPDGTGDADITILVTGHVLDYRDTAEIARILKLLHELGLIPLAEWRARRYDVPLDEHPFFPYTGRAG